MMVLCKPHYTRLCESDVKVKKVRIALLSYFFIEFLIWNYTGNREHYSMIYTGNIGDYGTHIERHYTECYVTNGCNERLHSAI